MKKSKGEKVRLVDKKDGDWGLTGEGKDWGYDAIAKFLKGGKTKGGKKNGR